MLHKNKLFGLTLVILILLSMTTVFAIRDEDEPPPEEGVSTEASTNVAPINSGDLGTVLVTGLVEYTNPFFTMGTSEPLIILEDQTGFVDRDRNYLFPPESQVLGQITSDFFVSPFSYSLALPVEPQGVLRDVDQDGVDEAGVMVFAVAYWTNTFGDAFLEERDLYGGGWSSAYASTRISSRSETLGEVYGGKYIVFAPDSTQSFPSGFGADEMLFTDDDPIVDIPAGYTVVDMDTEPFTFIREREVVVDLIEGEGSEADDFSNLGFAEAFDAMVEKFRLEYAFTEYKNLNWDAIHAELRPRFEEAEANNDLLEYFLALRDFTWEIPDGHVGIPFGPLAEMFQLETEGGLGMAIRQLDDGRVIVNFLLEGGPAERAGVEMAAEILEINGVAIDEALENTNPWSMPFSTEHVLRLQQLRYAIRFPLDTPVSITYQNPENEFPSTTTITTVAERESFAFSSFNSGLNGFELPMDFTILPNGYVYAKIYSFSDDDRLLITLWERMINTMNANGIPGLIIDMRQNGGGSGFLADQMAAYFFDDEHVTGQTAYYDEDQGDFYIDPDTIEHFYLPSQESRFYGEVAVLVGPNCNSACEFFSYNMTIDDRAEIVGQYPTAGLGGSVEQFFMPEGVQVRFTIGRAMNGDGDIHIEGIGVVPTLQVPVDETTLFYEGDPILDAAINHLDEVLGN